MGSFNKQSPGDSPGFVYMARRGPFVKVGHTKLMVDRLRTIKDVSTPPAARQYPVEIIWSLECTDQVTTERALHQRLESYHVSHEWFILPDGIVRWIGSQTEAGICEGYDPKRYRRTDSSRYGNGRG